MQIYTKKSWETSVSLAKMLKRAKANVGITVMKQDPQVR